MRKAAAELLPDPLPPRLLRGYQQHQPYAAIDARRACFECVCVCVCVCCVFFSR
jgi:hypothetical protein